MHTAAVDAAIIVVAILAAIILLVRSARSLRRANSELNKDWLNIEKLLKQRNDEMPRLIQTWRSYVPSQSECLNRVSEARSMLQRAASLEEKARGDARMTQALRRLFSEAERHPELKTNQNFAQLENRLIEIEERIAERGEIFNEDVARFNARLARFPGSVSGRRLSRRMPFQALEGGSSSGAQL